MQGFDFAFITSLQKRAKELYTPKFPGKSNSLAKGFGEFTAWACTEKFFLTRIDMAKVYNPND
jgi:hypothetical protein